MLPIKVFGTSFSLIKFVLLGEAENTRYPLKKPLFSTVTTAEYLSSCILLKRNRPRLSVVVVLLPAFTVAPVTALLLLSITLPVTFPSTGVGFTTVPVPLPPVGALP